MNKDREDDINRHPPNCASQTNEFIIQNINDFLKGITRFRQPLYFLELIFFLQQFNLQLTQHTIDNFFQDIRINPDLLIKFFQVTLIYPCLEFIGYTQEQSHQDLLYFSTSLHGFFFITLCLGLLEKSCKIGMPTLLMKILQQSCSIIFTIYYPLLLIPFLQIYFSFFFDNSQEINENSINLFLSILNLIMLLIIIFLIIYLQFEYKLILSNHDGRRQSANIYFILFMLDLIMNLMYYANLKQYLQIMHAILIFTKLLINCFYQPLYSFQLQSLKISGYIIYIIYSIIMYLSTSSTEQARFDPLLLFIISAPLSTFLSRQIQKILLKQFILDKLPGRFEFYQIDYKVRLLIGFFLGQQNQRIYSDEIKLLFYQGLIVNHISECRNPECLQCSKFQMNGQTRLQQLLHQQITTTQDLLNEGFNSNDFIQIEINKLMNKYFNKNKNMLVIGNIFSNELYTSTYYLNLYYKIEIEKNVTQSYSLLYKLKSKLKYASLLNKYIYHQIEQTCHLQFSHLFKDSFYQNQRLQMHYVAEFDEKFKSYNILMTEAFRMQQKLYMFLCSDKINLKSLIQINTKILNYKQNLELDLLYLYDLNPSSPLLLKLTNLFIEYFDDKLMTLQEFHHGSKQLPQNQLTNKDQNLDIFQENSCSIIISLSNALGIIKRASSSVKEVFNYDKEDLIYKNCNILMPSIIAQQHNNILQKFNDQGQLNIIEANSMDIYTISNSGFVIQVKRRISLFHDSQDLYGVAFFSLQQNQNNYIIISDIGKLVAVSEGIYQQMFSHWITSKQEIYQFYLTSFIPAIKLFGVNSQSQKYQQFETILIYPLNPQAFSKLPIIQDSISEKLQFYFNSVSNFDQFGFISIKFTIYEQSVNNLLTYQHLIIESMQSIKLNQLKKEKLHKVAKEVFRAFSSSNLQAISPNQLLYPLTQGGKQISPKQNQKNTNSLIQLLEVNKQQMQPTQDIMNSNFNSELEQQQQMQQPLQNTSILAQQQNNEQSKQTLSQLQQQQSEVTGQPDFQKLISSNIPNNILSQNNNPSSQRSISFEIIEDQNNYEHQLKQIMINKGNQMESDFQIGEQLQQYQYTNKRFNSPTNRQQVQNEKITSKCKKASSPLNQQQKQQQLSLSQDELQPKKNELLLQVNKEQLQQLQQQQQDNSQNKSKQALFQYLIHQKRQNSLVRQIQITAVLAYIILFICNLVAYIQLSQNFQYVNRSFNLISLSPELIQNLEQIILNKEFINIQQRNLFQSDLEEFSNSELLLHLQKIVDYSFMFLKEQILLSINDNTGQIYNFNEDTLMNINLYSDTRQKILKRFNVNYANLLLLFYANVYSFLNDDKQTENFMANNFITYTSTYYQQMIQTKNRAQQAINDMNGIVLITLIVIEIVGLIISFIIFPIYYIIQKKREKILMLQGTFPQQKLNQLIQQTQFILEFDFKQSRLSSRQISQNKKKKTISAMDSLDKFSYKLLFFSLFCLFIISLSPLIQLIITKSYLNNFQYNQDEMIILQQSQVKIFQQYSYTNILIHEQLQGQSLTVEEKVQNNMIIEENQALIKQILQLMENLDISSRSTTDDYRQFIYNLFKGDVCQVINNEEDKIIIDESETTFYMQQCNQLSEGVLTKGFIQTFKFILKQLEGISEILFQNNTKTIELNLKMLNDDESLIDYHLIHVYITKLFDIFRSKIALITYNQYQEQEQKQFDLFIIQIFLSLLMFLVCWSLLIKYMNQLLSQTQQMLGIFRINQIIENPYIMQFINTELIGIKF